LPPLLRLAAQGDAGRHVGDFLIGEGHRGRVAQRFELRQPGAGRQIARVAIRADPVSRRRRQPPLDQQRLAVLDQPVVQPRPLVNQRFMRDLDGRLARLRIVVEGEQAELAERVQHRLQIGPAHLGDARQFGPPHAPPRAAAIVEIDHAQEQLPGDGLPVGVHHAVQLFGAAGERFQYAAAALVGFER